MLLYLLCEALLAAGCCVNFPKCHWSFGAQQEFLGMIVDRHDIRLSDVKLSAIAGLLRPTTEEEFRYFLGMIGYLR